ncbi:MAG: hypothetical protein AB1489_12655 [Acidobacteriota bacterium]
MQEIWESNDALWQAYDRLVSRLNELEARLLELERAGAISPSQTKVKENGNECSNKEFAGAYQARQVNRRDGISES